MYPCQAKRSFMDGGILSEIRDISKNGKDKKTSKKQKFSLIMPQYDILCLFSNLE